MHIHKHKTTQHIMQHTKYDKQRKSYPLLSRRLRLSLSSFRSLCIFPRLLSPMALEPLGNSAHHVHRPSVFIRLHPVADKQVRGSLARLGYAHRHVRSTCPTWTGPAQPRLKGGGAVRKAVLATLRPHSLHRYLITAHASKADVDVRFDEWVKPQ